MNIFQFNFNSIQFQHKHVTFSSDILLLQTEKVRHFFKDDENATEHVIKITYLLNENENLTEDEPNKSEKFGVNEQMKSGSGTE